MHAERPGDPAVAALAAVQHGAISYRPLRATGLGRGAIAHRVKQGRLHRVHRGVFLVGHAAEAPLARESAALLACGPGAALSHRSAACLWGLLREAPGDAVDVTVAKRDCGRRPGIRAHRVRALAATALTQRRGLPVTGPARTVMDLGDGTDRAAFERAVEEALVQRLTDEDELRAVAATATPRPGAARLTRLLSEHAGPALTRSEAERRLLALIDSAKLPRPRTNAVIGRHEVDAVWPAARLVVEVDGFAFHGSRAAFERDRSRDADLQALGYRVLRITWRQLADRPEPLLVNLARLLAPQPR